MPGALLRNSTGNIPADWDAVTKDSEIDIESYYRLYERRILPCLRYADELGRQAKRSVLATVPGLGCGQFAGPFAGRLGALLRDVLITLLAQHGHDLPHIGVVYYDPYNECKNERYRIHETDFLVRPLMKGNAHRPQLCQPQIYADPDEDYSDYLLCSLVAWDHVSWPGNDFYAGSRATDDGVKAAATSVMTTMTGIKGTYDSRTNKYMPPTPFRTWGELVRQKHIPLQVGDNLHVTGT